MSVLSRQKNEPTAIVENTSILLSEGAANKARCRMSTPALRKITSLSRVRKHKVLAVRQQLAEGTYDLDQRLDAAVDRFLAAVTT
jgi:anti-sigma28 factor (negative regulator of flagellin synthesis)